jgi:hypothetical protein
LASGSGLAQAPSNCQVSGTGPITQDPRFAALTMVMRQGWRCTVSSSGSIADARMETAPGNGRVEFSGGNFTYVPNPGFAGSDSWMPQAAAPGARP